MKKHCLISLIFGRNISLTEASCVQLIDMFCLFAASKPAYSSRSSKLQSVQFSNFRETVLIVKQHVIELRLGSTEILAINERIRLQC